MFPIKCGKLKIELEYMDDDSVYAITVKEDVGGNIVGRGEVVRLGNLVENVSIIKDEVTKHMESFDAKVAMGTKRMNDLIYKVKVINSQMASSNLMGNKNSLLS